MLSVMIKYMRCLLSYQWVSKARPLKEAMVLITLLYGHWVEQKACWLEYTLETSQRCSYSTALIFNLFCLFLTFDSHSLIL